jgi:hypothetical protein
MHVEPLTAPEGALAIKEERTVTLTRKVEERSLSAEERELVARTHQPGIASLPDEELEKLRKLVRERRDRAVGISRRQRREIRGKATPRGTVPAAEDSGSRLKVSLLAQAMKRLNKETVRRSRLAARAELVDSMRRALAMKQAAGRPPRPVSRTARKGMKSKPSERIEQITDPREVGRVSQFVKQGQARRDT